MAVSLSLTYFLVLLELAASSHFRGGIVQWRPLNNNPMSFNGQVEVTIRIAWRRNSGGVYCDASTISSRTLLGGGTLSCSSGCSGSIGSLQYYCTDFSVSENWSAGERTYIYNAGSATSIEARYASCCWISLNRGGGSWEIRVRMNLSPRSDNGLINTSPISNMPPIVRVQRNCNGRIAVPVSDADGDDVRCRWASSSRRECAGVCQTFPATLAGCALTFTANSLSNGWYGVALQIEDFASTTSTTPMSSIPLQFLVFVFSSSASCASRPVLVGVTPPDGSCYPVAPGSTWSARIVAQSGSSSISISDIVTASPSGLTKSSLRSLGSNQWYVDVTWSPSPSQMGPSIFCYYAQDSVGLSSTQSCITLLGGVTPPRPVSMSPTREILSSNREWTIVYEQPFRRPTTSKYIRVYDGSAQVVTIDATSTSLVTYPSSNLGRSLTFRTTYNFVIGRSYNIRLDQGVAVDATYCGLNSTAITDSSFWSVTAVVCFSGMVRLVNMGSYDFEGRVEVCVNGGWGTVCDDGWSETDARVVCRQLNLTTSGIVAYSSAQYGQGSGPILIDDVACSGTEMSLQNCSYDSNTGDCSHAEDAGVRCHTLPTVLSLGGIGNGSPAAGEYVYFWIPSWSSAGVTVSITLRSGSVVCYASDRFQTPSSSPGYADWVVTITNQYTEMYLNPSTLGRPIGSFLSFAFLGQQSANNFSIQVDSGQVITSVLSISSVISRTLGNGVIVYYNLAYPSNGLTLTLTVTSGRIICYASVSVRNPTESNYDWKVDTTGREEAYLDPAILSRVDRPRVFIALVGRSSSNRFMLNSTRGGSSAVELTIGGFINTTVAMNRFLYFSFPFTSSGITIRINALVGGIRCYASDTNPRPSSMDYIWTLIITGYDDAFLDPSRLGRTPGSTVYVALQGVNTMNSFTLNTTIGDTSIQDVNVGTAIGDTISNGIFKFYSFPFPSNGITLSLTVTSGYVNCYASDRYRNPDQYQYDWFVEVRNYFELYLDPRMISRPVGSFLHVSFLGVDLTNVYQVNSSSGDTLTVVPQQPTGVQAANISPTSATISWSISLPSRVTPWSIIVNYRIVLTEYALGLPDFVANTTTDSYTFTTLEEFNNYTVIVAAENTVGLGDFSVRFNFSTPQAAPTAPPLNTTGNRVSDTPTLITLSWLPPEAIHINGIIDHYVVRVTEVYTRRVFILRAEETTILVGPLHPFYIYECQVAAFTVGLGPFGRPFTAQAGETEPTAAPQNISFATRNASSITLSWNPPPFEHQNGRIRSYSIIATHTNSGSQWRITTNSSTTNYTVGGLQPFMNYTFSLAAETISLGPFSVSVTIGTVEGVPTVAPDNFAVRVVSATALYVSWSSVFTLVGDVRDYIVRLLEVDTGLVTDIRSAATSITVPVHPAYTYNCSVSAVTVSHGPFSTVITVQTPQDAPSGSPLNVLALPTSSRSVIVTWDPPPASQRNGEIVSYTINVTGHESGEEFQLNLSASNLTLSSLRPYFTYSFTVAASTIIGEGPFSLTFTIRMPEDFPSAPVSVRVGTIDGLPDRLSVSWQPPVVPNGLVLRYIAYCFEISDDEVYGSGYLGEADNVPTPMSLFEEITSNATSPGSSTQTAVDGLDPYTRYACFVTASTSVGEGEPSYASSGITAESVPGSPPINLVPDVTGSTYILLSWYPPEIPNGRVVSYTITYNQTRPETLVVVRGVEQYRVTGLYPYSYYQFTVFASTAVGDGPPTSPIIQRTAADSPSSAPVNFTAIAMGRSSAQFSWQPPSSDDVNGILAYYVLRIFDESFNLTDISVNITNTSYAIDSLEEYVRYSCQVAAATEVGVGPYSSPIVITTQQDVPTAPPQSLRGSVESSTLILLSWDSPPPYDRNGEIVYYLIHMRELDTGRFWTLPVFNRKTTAYVGSLHPYYRYECRVAAQTIALGPYSDSVVLQTNEEAPSSPPMAILPSLVTDTSFTLSWQPPPFEGSNGVIRLYIIQILELDTGTLLTETSNITEITLEDLHPFYSYSCRIAAETIGLGPFSTAITVLLNENVPTSPPTLTSYYALSSTSLYFSWIAPPVDQRNGIIRRYDLTLIELETGAVFRYSTAATNFTAALLRPNYAYQVEISAFTISSGPTSVPLVVLTPEDAPSAPPEMLSVDEIYPDSIELSWSPPPPPNHNGEITGYNVTVTATNTGITLTVFSVANSTVIGSLTPFTTYIYSVAAVTNAGTGPFSSPNTVTTAETAPFSPPEDLNVTTITSSSVSLVWLPPPVVLRNGVVREYVINVTEVDSGRELVFYSSTSSITISSLHPFYTYLCRVSAFTVEYGPYTANLQFVTLEDAPSGFPQGVSVSTVSSASLELSWTPLLPDERNGIITGYWATLTRRGTGSQVQLFTSATSIIFSMLNPFTSYVVTVSASTSVGIGPQSSQLTFSTAEDVPVGAPLNPSGIVIDSRTLSFSWEEPAEEHRNGIIQEYRVNITVLDTGRQFQVVSSTTSISLSSLHPYYTYQWVVSAFTIGEGPYTAIQTISTPQDVPSGPPQSFAAVSTGVTSISLAWQLPLLVDRNGIITGYTVTISLVSGTETRRISTQYTNLTVTSLSPYSTYECIVAAYTSVGEGPPSNILLIQTQETNPIGTPSNTSGVALNSTHIYLDWDPLPPDQQFGELREYRIAISELETSYTFQVSSASDVTEATIGPLHPYYTYNCTIIAVTVGEGPPSTVITVRTEEDVPSGPPTNFTVSPVSSTSAQLSWDLPHPQQRNGIIRQFVIQVEPLAGQTFSITTAGSSSSFVVSALRPFTSHLFSVAAITIGRGPATQQIQIQTFTDIPGGPPEAVTAQPLNSTSLALTWEPPALEVRNGIIQRYTVEIREIETGMVTTLSTETTALNVTSLHPYYRYSCIVAAETLGVGPYSYAVEVQLPESAPSSPPVDVQFNQVTSTSFILSWTAPPPEDHNGLLRHYVVSCTEQESGLMLRRLTINSTTERLVDSLHPFYNYICAIAAVTISEGPLSSSVMITTAQDAPSAAPVGLYVASLTSTSLSLNWMAPQIDRQNGIITGYSVNVTNRDTGESMLYSTRRTSITIERLRAFTAYLCSVAAQTAVGLGPYSSTLIITTDEDDPVGVPVSLVVVSSTSTSLTLSWSPPPQDQLNGVLRHYVVVVEELDSARNLTLTSINSQIVLADLHPFYTYRVSVCPVTLGVGPCAYFEPVQLPQEAPSGSPENIVATSLSSTSVELSWDPPVVDQRNGIITNYYINVTEVETGMVSQLMVTGTTQQLVDSLHPYYVYNFYISAATTVGQGPYSPVFSIQTPEDAPSLPPFNTSVEVLGPSTISVSWQPPAPVGQNGIITSYIVLVTRVLTNTTTRYQRDGSRTEIVVANLQPFHEYSCSVAASTSVGSGPYSPPFTITTHQDAPSLPPQNVQGSVANSTSIQLTWEPPIFSGQNGIIEYYIVSVTEAETMRQFVLTAVTTAITAVDLHPYYTYSFAVSAVTIAEGPYTQTLSLQTQQDAPSGPPQLFRVVAISSTSIRLTWAAPLPGEQNGVITSYRITITAVESGEVLQQTASASDSFLVVRSLSPHFIYRCAIAAYTIALGPETFSDVTTPQEAPSGSPRNTSVTAIGSSVAEFVWLPPLAEETNGIVIGYTIRVTGQDSDEVIELQSNATGIQVERLHPFYSYVFTVAARTEAGSGPFSPVVYLQMPTAVPIGIIRNLTVEIDSSTSVRVSWLPINPSNWNGIVTVYVVVYERQGPAGSVNAPTESYVTSTASIPFLPEHPLANSPDPRLVTMPLNVESLQLRGLEENYVYEFTVYCENTAGRSDSSNPVIITMPSSVPTGVPVNVTIEVKSSTEILVSWLPPEQLKRNGMITSYYIQINSTSVSIQPRTQFLPANTTSVLITGLEKYTDFLVSVVAGTSLGYGPFSLPVVVKTLEDIPGVPVDLQVAFKGKSSSTVRVSWSPPSLANGIILDYQVHYEGYKAGEKQQTTVGDVVHRSSSRSLEELEVSNLTNGLTYQFKVRARTSVGYGNFTDAKEIKVPLSMVDTDVSQRTDSGTIAVAVIFAILGWIALIVVVTLAIAFFVVWCRRQGHTGKSKLGLEDTSQAASTSNVNLQSITTRDEESEGDVIRNIAAVDDQAEASKDTVEDKQDTRL